jgi:hypothetical protein
MAKEVCEHIEVWVEPNFQFGRCKCEKCGKEMSLSAGFQYLFIAIRKRIKEMDKRLEQ